jgi:hypothetical protein
MLVRSIDTIKEYMPASAALDFNRISPILPDAEQRVIDAIGLPLYLALDSYLSALPFVPNPKYNAVIKLLQSAISWIVLDIGFDILNSHLSNQGFHRIENEQGKKPMFQRQELEMRATFRTGGANRIDMALAYLEANASDFAIWTASDAYTAMRDNYVWTTQQFQSILNINNSRLVFLRLRQTMQLVTDLHIRPLIGSALQEEILSQIAANNLSPANAALLPYLQKALAHKTMDFGSIELMANIEETGIYILANASNMQNTSKKDPAREEVLASYMRRAAMNAKSYLKGLETYLLRNADTYPLYRDSEAYDRDGSMSPFLNEGKIFLT